MQIYTDHEGRVVNAVHTRSQSLPGGDFSNLFVVKHGEGSSSLHFQTGSPAEYGVNGLSTQCVLAALIERTRKLNEVLPCGENEVAVMAMQEALEALEQRAAVRLAARAIELDRV